MTFKNDQNSADLLASEMETILGSAEYKELFKKEAQVQMGLDLSPTSPGMPQAPGQSSSMTLTDNPSGAANALPSQVDPAKTPKTSGLSGDLKSQLSRINENPSGFAGINGDAVGNLAGKILAGTATAADLDQKSPAMQNLYSAINKDTLGSQKNIQGMALALQTINTEKTETPTATAKDDMLNTLVKIANELGEKGLIISEAIADSLINSIVVEAKKKVKEDKKAKKKAKKEDKKMKKLEKKTKKDMKCEKCKKLCDECECE